MELESWLERVEGKVDDVLEKTAMNTQHLNALNGSIESHRKMIDDNARSVKWTKNRVYMAAGGIMTIGVIASVTAVLTIMGG